ncbi:MAG: flagellar hook-length control protein FliK [Gemmatimonadaceae bacterium]
MTLPILPFTSGTGAAPATFGTDAGTPAVPFSTLLGSALDGSSSAPMPPIAALLGQLVASATPRGASRAGNQGSLVFPGLEQITSDQADALMSALTSPLADADTQSAGEAAMPHLQGRVGSRLSAGTREALIEALRARYPHVGERVRVALAPNPDRSPQANGDPATTIATADSTSQSNATVGQVPVAVAQTPLAIDMPGAIALSVPAVTSQVPTLLRNVLEGSDPNAIRRDVTSLRPEFRERVDALIDRMQREFGYTVEVVETVRSQARQDALFAQGRSAPGPVVTWTRTSPHQDGRAVDVKIDGSFENPVAFARLARVAQEFGLRTLWPRDPGHVEMSANPSLALSHEPVVEANLSRTQAASVPTNSGSTSPARLEAGSQLAPRGPVSAGVRAAIERPLAPLVSNPLRSSVAPNMAPLPSAAATRNDAMTAGNVVPQTPGQVPASSTLVQMPATARAAHVAAVAAVAAIAPVAQPARVADVAVVASVAGPTPEATPSRPTRDVASQVSRAVSESIAAASVPAPTPVSDATPAPMDQIVDRVIAAVNAHLERDEQRGNRDERGRERDLVAAVRERVEAGGSRDALRPFDGLTGRGESVRTTDAPAPLHGADRVAQVMELRDVAAERPLSSVVLRLDHPEGGEDRIRIDLRGQSISTVMDVRDPAAADRMANHASELSRALEQRGLEPDVVTIRAVRSDSTWATAAGAVSDRDAGRVASPGSTASSNSGMDRDPRDPHRAYDHQQGDGRSRHRRDPKGAR